MNKQVMCQLNLISQDLNKLYGYVKVPGLNSGEPAINSGPCGAFAYEFYKQWNSRFPYKVKIAFLWHKNRQEWWHTLIAFSGDQLFDGGIGVHSVSHYDPLEFDLVIMNPFSLDVLEERSHGLKRKYPTYCPKFSLEDVSFIINQHLEVISELSSCPIIRMQNIAIDTSDVSEALSSILTLSIGNNSEQKLTSVLESYSNGLNAEILGAYLEDKLIGVLGCCFDKARQQITVTPIAVADDQQGKGIGTQMINFITQNESVQTIVAETDEDAVHFYQNLGFECSSFKSKYGNKRYHCELRLENDDRH